MSIKRSDIVELVKQLHWLCVEKNLYREGEFNSTYAANASVIETYAKPFLTLQEGQPSVGHAWRLCVTGGAYGTGHSYMHEFGLPSGDYLGWTKREAYETLKQVISTVSDLPSKL